MGIIRLGQVGTGTWGNVMLDAWTNHQHAEVVAVCDLDGDRAKATAQKYGISAYFDNPEEMYKDSSIGAVGVATPDFAHRDPVVGALNAGKHVLIQKPMATTVADCRDMVDAVNASEQWLMVDFQHRWGVGFVEAHKALREGSFGAPVHGSIKMSNSQLVPRERLGWANQSSVLWFLGTHTVDLVRYVLGEEVKEVYATATKTHLAAKGVDTFDFYQATLRMESGASIQMENSWVLPENDLGSIEMKFDLYGANECIRVNQSPSNLVTLSGPTGWSQPAGSRGVVMARGRSLDYFIECLVEGNEPSITAHDGLMNTAVLLAIETSARENRVVTLEEVLS